MKHDALQIELPPLVLQLPAGVGEGWSAHDLAQLKTLLHDCIEQEVRLALARRPMGDFSNAEVARVSAAIATACQSACTHKPGARR
ncbi:hypothetical protein DBR47_22230 [Paucibacter sp. KBW04]|uniref:hypothetical protein n=1 Tax=Paucibacter sp. KBW04 TaxID=2153361 RepID=UPI000F589959|nr:hypothetical protein [Paucibacter sp. KBW04]RQO54787.1 hypothetical protein DBR47_22230 [Paucibacter sp. KBW04]